MPVLLKALNRCTRADYTQPATDKMKKGILFIITIVGLLSCKQSSKSNQNNVDTAKLRSPTNVLSQKPYGRLIDTKFEYADSEGQRIIIQNSLPKGEGYTDPTGKEYFKTVFWTQITNETDNPLELKIDFPVDSYELPTSPGRRFKILLPSDTVRLANVKLPNHGLTDLESFPDTTIQKSASLRRTIRSKESSGFYVVILFDKGVGGPFRTGLSIKGQTLVYRISRFGGPANSLTDEKEINCGSISLSNLVLQK